MEFIVTGCGDGTSTAFKKRLQIFIEEKLEVVMFVKFPGFRSSLSLNAR